MIVALLAEIGDLDHVRVADLRGEGGLVQKHLLELSVFTQLREHGFYCDDLLKAARAFDPRSPDHRHAACCNRQQQLVSPEHVPLSDLPDDGLRVSGEFRRGVQIC